MNYISTTSNQALMAQALKSLTGKWGIAIGSWVVFILLTGFSFNISIWEWQGDNGENYKSSLDIIGWIIAGPLSLGFTSIILLISRNKTPHFTLLFSGFRRFAVSLAAYLLMVIFMILWLLLLIIPGIIAALRYSQTWYILSEDKNIGALEAINKSKEMMVGNKWKLFCLYFRFLGWFVLCILTLGLGFIVLAPYMSVSFAKIHDDLMSDNLIEKTDSDEKSQETIGDKLTESHELENDNKEEDKGS